jgi:hypothetical protein
MLLDLATVKSFLGTPVSASSDYDSELLQVIEAVEAQAARFCQRIARAADGSEVATFEASEVEEIFEGRKRRESLRLSIFPLLNVESIRGVVFAGDTDEDTIDPADYFVSAHNGNILFPEMTSAILASYQIIKVKYTGGYYSSTLPADLKLAMLEAIRWNWKDGVSFGIKEVSSANGIVVSEAIFPPQVEKVLMQYRKLG